MHTYACIYIYIYIERERDTYMSRCLFLLNHRSMHKHTSKPSHNIATRNTLSKQIT